MLARQSDVPAEPSDPAGDPIAVRDFRDQSRDRQGAFLRQAAPTCAS
ncbi:MAG: hypothetical protein WBC44_16655 [Planctomycetaceae bacterium]